MTCGLAVANSPSFSSSRVTSPYSKSTASSPSSLCSPSSVSFPSSPLSIRLRNGNCGLFRDYEKKDRKVCESSGPVLKRKRTLRIDIPLDPLSFDGLGTPLPEVDRFDEMVEEGDGYAVYCKRGKRSSMEDRFSALVEDCGNSKQGFFGVFDGHGGAKAAEFVAKNLRENIQNAAKSRGGNEMEEAVREGYIKTDEEFLKEDVSGGTCCVTAIILNGDLIVSNAGDCRAVMSRGGVAEALTSDHKAGREDEMNRIESAGGYVDLCRGVWRIQGSLAVSRAIGDRSLKQWVLSEPETRILKIKPDCEFLILASDGLWDMVDNQEAVDIVKDLFVGAESPNLTNCCKKLVEMSTSRGSKDDTSVMIVRLGSFAS